MPCWRGRACAVKEEENTRELEMGDREEQEAWWAQS